MPEADKEGERYSADSPQASPGFFLKGSHQLDWGMKHRLSTPSIPSRPDRDAGLRPRLLPGPDHRAGAHRPDDRAAAAALRRAVLHPRHRAFDDSGRHRTKPVFLRASGGPSILKELSDEQIAMDIEDAIRLDAAGIGIQVFIGGEHETRSVHNMTRLVDMGMRDGIR